VTARGFADELSERGYLIIDGIDGRAHYVVLPQTSDDNALPMGGIVEIRARGARTADQTIARISRSGVYRTEEHLQIARAQASAGHDPEALVSAHVRRLEALRRAGIVERVDEGVWRIPDNLPERGRAYDLDRSGHLDVKLVTPLGIEKQQRAVGVTWLDQQLIRGESLSAHGFGADARNALRQRLAFLMEEGLAFKEAQA
jgi:hypothetical protein